RFGGEEGFQRGWLLDLLWHLALPVFCLSYTNFAFLSKLTRGSILENLRSDFVRTARAKGVGEKTVLWQHVFRNSLLPLITVAAFVVPSMLAGSVIVETIFSIPGMGRLMIQAIQFKDQEVVMSVTLVAGILTLAAYLLADLLYAVADPRVSYE
ncbi:MAG: ABC transporter permease, partial [Phycisphaeraceae bacterium]